MGGGVKSFSSEGFKQWGSTLLTHNCWSNGNTTNKKILVGGSNPGRLTLGGAGGAKTHPAGFEPPTLDMARGCFTTRPLPDLK